MSATQTVKIGNREIEIKEIQCLPEHMEGSDPQLEEFLRYAQNQKQALNACLYIKGARRNLLVIDTRGTEPLVGHYDLGAFARPMPKDIKDSIEGVLGNG